jgi:hypothetical protein
MDRGVVHVDVKLARKLEQLPGNPRSSTSAAPAAPPPVRSSGRSSPATAQHPAATNHPTDVRPTTYGIGPTADPPTSTTSSSCAGTTTANDTSTTPTLEPDPDRPRSVHAPIDAFHGY